jgi:hypothetical protein
MGHIIFCSVVLSVSLRKNTLRMLENREVRRIFGPTRKEEEETISQ